LYDTAEQITAKEWVLKDVATIIEAETEGGKSTGKILKKMDKPVTNVVQGQIKRVGRVA
jgi:hypothetical protein